MHCLNLVLKNMPCLNYYSAEKMKPSTTGLKLNTTSHILIRPINNMFVKGNPTLPRI